MPKSEVFRGCVEFQTVVDIILEVIDRFRQQNVDRECHCIILDIAEQFLLGHGGGQVIGLEIGGM